MAAHDHRTIIASVLRGAAHRVRHGKAFGWEGCACQQRAEGPPFNKSPWPAADASSWCFVCAVEAETDTQGAHPDYFGHCLVEVTFELSGQRFALIDFAARDRVLFDAIEDLDGEGTAALFEKAAARLDG